MSVFIWKQSNMNYPGFLECQFVIVQKRVDKIKSTLKLFITAVGIPKHRFFCLRFKGFRIINL